MESPRPRALVVNNAIHQSKFEELLREFKRFKQWKPFSDVWCLRFGTALLGIASTTIGMYINTRFRKKLKLLSSGYILSYFSVTAAPFMLIGGSYPFTVMEKIVLGPLECPLCLEAKGILLQIVIGTVYPLILSPVTNIMIAGEAGYSVPRITEVKKIGEFVYSVVKPMYPKLLTLTVLNAMFGAYIVNQQLSQMNKVRMKRMLRSTNQYKP